MHTRSVIVHNAWSLAVCCAALSISAACNKAAPEPEPSVTKSEATAPKAVNPAEAKPASSATSKAPAHPLQEEVGIEWTAPEGWQLGPQRPMRKATYVIPKAAGEAENAELAVFYFGEGQGGDVAANIERWTAQFGDVKDTDIKRSERTANELKQTVVEIPKGTYTNSMAMHGPSGPQKNFALLGAVVEAPSGKYFFKMTGPEKTVAAARDDFFKLLDSTKVKP